MTAQMALDWGARMETTTKTLNSSLRVQESAQNRIQGKRPPTTYGGDWSERDDPLPDPSVLLRSGSPRCLCNNGCRQVFSSESAYERHIEMLDDGTARCRTPAELRTKRERWQPMARDAAGVWYSPRPGGAS